MGETDPTANNALASAAETVLLEAEEKGEPIAAKGPPRRGPGRPSNEDVAEREAEEAADRQKLADQKRAHAIIHKLMGMAARKPVEGLSAKLGGAMKVDDEETELVAEAAELYITNRVGVMIEGEKVFDYAFYGALAFVFGRRIVAWGILSRLNRRRMGPGIPPPEDKNDDAHLGAEALREIDSGAAPSVETQAPADSGSPGGT